MTTTSLHHTALDLDPRRLILEANIRHDADADAALVASIRQHGVLQPIVVEEPEPDRFVVLAGHRRTLAAIEAGLAMVPVTVVANRQQSERVLAQLAENDHRTALTDVDHAQAYQQLALLGLSAEQIAEYSSTAPERVQAGLTVARSARALDILTTMPNRTLDELAAAEEFADDPDVYDGLVNRENFAYRLERARRDRRLAQLIARTTEDLEGLETVVPYPEDEWSGKSVSATLRYLDVTEKTHASCPGRAVALRSGWRYSPKRASEDEPFALAEEVCRDWRANGHQHDGVKPKSAELPDDVREAQAAEQREVIAKNKAWPIATKVRRDWIKTHLAGVEKRTDRTTATWVTNWILANLHGASPDGFLADWLGVATGWRQAKPLVDVSLARLDMIQLGWALGGVESFLGVKDGWRSNCGRDAKHKALAGYLGLLEHLGYPLSPVERVAAGRKLRKGEEL